jgi:peptidoglycan/xylan/chitin deacetylase (PgdA/CDA1 family)
MAGNRLIVYNYHRIYKNDSGIINTIFDEGVYSASESQFRQQMIWLKKNTEILSEEKLLDIIRHGGTFSKPSSLVTFDDGYIDNYLIAYPILKQLEIPAIYFIPTQQISTRELGWWDVIAYIVKKSLKSTICLNNEEVQIADQSTAIKYIINRIKNEPYENTKYLLKHLSEACEVSIPDKDIQSNELMTWDQIREVSRGGIAIGSHTHSHRVLTTLSNESQREEISIAKTIIEHEIGNKIHSIAYPVGNYHHFSQVSQSIALECGYELGFSFNTGVNYGNKVIPFDIKRIAPQKEIALFTAMAMLPSVFAKRL